MPQVRAIVPDSGGVRHGLNSTVAAISARRIVKRSSATDTITPEVDGSDVPFGVTMAAIPIGSAGDVQVAGMAIVEAGAAVSIGDKVMGTTGGKGVTCTAELHFVGVANTAALLDGDLIEVAISPGVLPA